MVTIIGITAALATPTVVEQMRERRSRDAAQGVAQVYASARMRAMGRGSAVLVRYVKDGGFRTLEAIEGALAEARGYEDCAAAPGLGCLSNDWNEAKNSREVGVFVPATNLTVTALVPETSDPTNNVDVCFTPGGRTFASYDGTFPTAAMAGVVTFTVKRDPVGLLRRVVVLPTGTARLAL